VELRGERRPPARLLLAFAIAVAFVVWLDRRLSSRRLFRDIYRELGVGGRPP